MAAKNQCRGPVNRLVMLRAANLCGPFFQNVGDACVHSVGNAVGIGGPLSGPKPVMGLVDNSGQITVTLSQCIAVTAPACASPTGWTVYVDGATVNPSPVTVAGDGMSVTLGISPPIEPGDVVTVSYDGSSECYEDCDKGDPLETFSKYPVRNSLKAAGFFVLTEDDTGTATSIVLTEDDDGSGTSGIETEDAP